MPYTVTYTPGPRRKATLHTMPTLTPPHPAHRKPHPTLRSCDGYSMRTLALTQP